MAAMICSRVLRLLIRRRFGWGGVDAGFVDGGGVHAGGEVVTDLLLDGVAVLGGGCVLEDAPENCWFSLASLA